MSKPATRLWLFILMVLTVGFFPGCSTVRFYTSSREDLARDLLGPEGRLNKQVVVAGFQNASTHKELDLNALLTAPVKGEILDECKRVNIISDPRIEYQIVEHFGLITGLSRNLELMAQARAAGANALVTGSLWKVVQEQELRGVYGLRDMANVIKVSLDLWVYDPLTGAKLTDARISSEMVLKDGLASGETDWQSKVFSDIVEQIGDKVCDALDGITWTAFVKSVDGDRLTITAGKNTGIKKGALLWVCRDGELVEGVKGERFMVPGPRIAKAKVTEVLDASCTATLVGDGDISKAAWVTLRKKGDSINPI